MKAYKRRNYFIDKGAQSRFIVGFAVSSMLGGIIGIVCFVYFARRKIDATLYSMRLPEVAAADLLMNEMLLALGITILVVTVMFVLTAGKVFKRINGPLRKMAGVVQSIGSGDLHNGVSLRDNDEFKMLAGELDGLVKKLRQGISVLRNHAEQLEKLRHIDSEPGDKKLQVSLHFQALKKEIKTFKV